MSDELVGYGMGATAVADETTVPEEIMDGEGDASFQYDEPTGATGKFPPRITPGPVRFRIEVTKYDEVENNAVDASKRSVHTMPNGMVPVIEYTAFIDVADLRTRAGRLLRNIDTAESRSTFNSARGHKSKSMIDKHVSSGIEELHAGLGFTTDLGAPKSVADMVGRIRSGSGGRWALGQLGWIANFKNADGKTYTRFVTGKANEKRGERPWPVDAKGQLLTEIEFNGETKVAQERILRVYAPKAAKRAA